MKGMLKTRTAGREAPLAAWSDCQGVNTLPMGPCRQQSSSRRPVPAAHPIQPGDGSFIVS
eukprot:1824185-Rhodomonas_salina.2